MYYLIIIQNNNAQAIYKYDSLDVVMAAYHAELAYRAEGRTSTKCAILDSDMRIVRSEVYTAPDQEPVEGQNITLVSIISPQIQKRNEKTPFV